MTLGTPWRRRLVACLLVALIPVLAVTVTQLVQRRGGDGAERADAGAQEADASDPTPPADASPADPPPTTGPSSPAMESTVAPPTLLPPAPAASESVAPAVPARPRRQGGLPFPAPPAAPSAEPSAVPDTTCAPVPATLPLDVVTFNIHFGRHDGRSTLEPIAAALRTWDPDIVLLQEVDRFRRRSGFRDQPAWLGERLGMYAIYGANVLRAPEGPGRPRSEYGLAILSRFPIVEQANTLLPNRKGMEQRGLLRARVSIEGWTLDVYNTHLQHTSGAMRTEQMRAVQAELADDLFPHILGGDFNATPGSPPLRVAGSVLVDSWQAAGNGPGFTAPARRPGKRIDFLMHREPLTVRSADVLGTGASDHLAVRARYEFPYIDPCPGDAAGS